MKKKYLIILSGGSDVERYHIGEATWNWINSDPPDFKNHSFTEKVPDDVRAEASKPDKIPETVCVTSGSYDNDRAIFASIWSKSVTTGRGTFEDVYEGCIY